MNQGQGTQATNIDALVAKFSEYDFKFVIDGSGSMEEKDMNSRSRWDYMQETTVQLATALSQVDADGIDVFLLNQSKVTAYNNVTGDKVKEIFAGGIRPAGSTPMHLALQAALDSGKGSSKKQFILIATDGTPDNQKEVADVIRKQANSQASDDQCTILFIQVGHDKQATEYLRKLDDDLTGAKFDIVDAKTIQEVDAFSSIIELVAHAVTD